MSLFNPDCSELIEERARNANEPTERDKYQSGKVRKKHAKVRQSIEQLKDRLALKRLLSKTIEIGG